MNKSQLLKTREKLREQYRKAKAEGNAEKMKALEKWGRDVNMRLAFICAFCKDNEKNVKLYPFCSDTCKKASEQADSVRLGAEQSQLPIGSDEEIKKRQKRALEIAREIRKKKREALPIVGTKWRDE